MSRVVMSLVLLAAVVVAIGAPASAGEPARAATPAPSPASLQVSVDPRVELFAIIYRLAGFLYHGEEYETTYYEAAVQEHFGPYREHPAIALARRLKEEHNVDYGVQLSLAVHLDDADSLKLRVPLDPWPETLHERWTPELIDEFLAQARDFATESDFAGFVESQGPFCEETADRAERALAAGVQVDWFDSFFGPQDGREFHVFMCPLGGRHGYAFWVPKEEGLEAMSVLGAWRFDGQGKPVYEQGRRGTGFAAGVVHELGHSYVNPAVEPYLDQFEEPINRMKPFLVGYFARAYGQEHHSAIVRESLVRAAVVRYLDEHGGFLAGRLRLAKELKAGALWMPELLELLDQYEAQRDRYPSFAAFMPEVVAFFEAYSARIRVETARARATLPLYVVLLVVYLIAVWIPSRRRTTSKVRTRWDQIATVGLLYAALGPVFEFFLLGNRPGLASLITGAALLLAATLIGRRARPEAGATAPAAPQLSDLLVLCGAPLMLSALFSWIFSALAVAAMLLQARTGNAAVTGVGEC